MPIIVFPWLHTHNNSREKNVLTALGDTVKEYHGDTKVVAAFYENSSVCCLSVGQPLSTCKMQSEIAKSGVHQTGTPEGQAHCPESWDVRNPQEKSLGNASGGHWCSWIPLNLRDCRRCWVKPLVYRGVSPLSTRDLYCSTCTCSQDLTYPASDGSSPDTCTQVSQPEHPL